MPKKNPAVTCVSVCCRNIMRLEPTIPDAMTTRHSHQTELKLSMNENANSAPSTPPMAAVCRYLPPHVDNGTKHLYYQCHYQYRRYQMWQMQ